MYFVALGIVVLAAIWAGAISGGWAWLGVGLLLWPVIVVSVLVFVAVLICGGVLIAMWVESRREIEQVRQRAAEARARFDRPKARFKL